MDSDALSRNLIVNVYIWCLASIDTEVTLSHKKSHSFITSENISTWDLFNNKC